MPAHRPAAAWAAAQAATSEVACAGHQTLNYIPQPAMHSSMAAATCAAASSRPAASQRREAGASTARACRQKTTVRRAAAGRRVWAPRVAEPSAAGAAAAAAGEPATPAIAEQQSQQGEPAVDYAQVPAHVDFTYAADGCCTLRVSGPLSTGACPAMLCSCLCLSCPSVPFSFHLLLQPNSCFLVVLPGSSGGAAPPAGCLTGRSAGGSAGCAAPPLQRA